MNIKCWFGFHNYNEFEINRFRVCRCCHKYQEYVLTNGGMTKTWITIKINADA